MTRGAEPRKGRQEIDNLIILWLASCYYHVEACQRKNKYNCLRVKQIVDLASSPHISTQGCPRVNI